MKFTYKEARDYIVKILEALATNQPTLQTMPLKIGGLMPSQEGKMGGAFCSNIHAIKAGF